MGTVTKRFNTLQPKCLQRYTLEVWVVTTELIHAFELNLLLVMRQSGTSKN